MNRTRQTPIPQKSVQQATTPPGGATVRALSGWRARLASDPVPRLLKEGAPSILARIRRDLIDDSEAPNVEEIWGYPAVRELAKRFKPGGFVPAGPEEKKLGSAEFATMVSTIMALDHMADLGVHFVVKAGARRTGVASKPAAKSKKATTGRNLPVPPVVEKAVEFLLQSQERDGSLTALSLGGTPQEEGSVPAVHYQGWALAALSRLGFSQDPRVRHGYAYLLERRQDDGGWAWRGVRTASAARPSSHFITGLVLRAFAALPVDDPIRETRRAAELLSTRFLQPDRYPDRKASAHWEDLSDPRRFTDLLDALDSVTSLGLGKENSGVRTAEAYIRSRQNEDGLWYPGKAVKSFEKVEYGPKDVERALWMTLRVLVVLRRIN